MDTEYRYNFDIERIRETEFPNLKGVTYVDHVGTTLYAKSQLEAFHKDLSSNVYGNPHSRSHSSRLTTDTVDQIRYRVLRFFNASPDEYTVIFTSGCTGALKLVAETFTFLEKPEYEEQPSTNRNHRSHEPITDRPPGGCFVYLLDNHTSVQGMRELVSDRTSGVFCLEEEELHQDLPDHLNQIHTNRSPRSKSRSPTRFANQSRSNQSPTKSTSGSVPSQQTSKSSPIKTRTNKTSESNLHGQSKTDEFQRGQQKNQTNPPPNSVRIQAQQDKSPEIRPQCKPVHLFAYPAQSNFSGRKYPLQWIHDVQEQKMGFQKALTGRWYVVLDAASYVCSSHLDLQKYKPDFVTVSFYKIFGFPTGLGALLVKNTAEPMLKKQYFGGGTVAVSNARERFHVFRSSLSDRFEDGTISFLDIIALRHGMNTLQRITGGMERVSQHTFAVAKYFHDHLVSLRHGNGTLAAQVYLDGFEDICDQGPIVNFNIIRQDGQFVGFAEVDKLAQLHDIHLRTGCFCNIGACQQHLNLTTQQIRDNFDAGHVCGDDRDMIDGRPTGSVRISFGYMSTYEDARQCLKFISESFLEDVANLPEFTVPRHQTSEPTSPDPVCPNHCQERSKGILDNSDLGDSISPQEVSSNRESGLKQAERDVLKKCSEQERFLTNICLYPVKSCAAFQVAEWEIGPRGLMYDREWMIVSESGVTLGQKREPKLCLLRPEIDLITGTLTLNFPDMPCFMLSLAQMTDGVDAEGRLCTNKVCGDRVKTYDCGDTVSDWLSEALGRPGTRLLRQKQEDGRTGRLKDASGHASESPKLSLANESQFLLISRESVRSLQKRMTDRDNHDSKSEQGGSNVDMENLIHRFRGNLIIGGGSSFEEDEWDELVIGTDTFMCQGQCSRCQMVCVDQQSGERSKEPLRTLVAWRGKRVPFGIHTRREVLPEDSERGGTLRVGDIVVPASRKIHH